MTVSSTYEAGMVKAVAQDKPYNRKLLRITSLIFAIMLALFFVGLGGRIFMERTVNRMITESSIRLTGEHRHVLTQWVAAIVRQDVQAFRFAEVDMEKLNDQYFYKGDGSSYIVKDPDDDAAYDYTISENPYTGKLKASYEDKIAQINSTGEGLYGMRWTALRIAGYYWAFMLVGGILAVAALIFWFAKGGRMRNISDTAIVPLGAVIVAIGVLCIVLFCFLSADFPAFARVVVSNSGISLAQ